MKLFRILSLVAFSLSGFAATAAAQEAACALTAEAAPEVRGLRLGMSLDQLRARFPGAQFGEDSLGVVPAHLDQTVLRAGENAAAFQGVSQVHLLFVDERLRRFEITYMNSIRWESAAQFAARVSEALKLPAAWKDSGVVKEMACAGFDIRASTNVLTFEETGTSDVVGRRRKEKQERDRQSFKP